MISLFALLGERYNTFLSRNCLRNTNKRFQYCVVETHSMSRKLPVGYITYHCYNIAQQKQVSFHLTIKNLQKSPIMHSLGYVIPRPSYLFMQLRPYPFHHTCKLKRDICTTLLHFPTHPIAGGGPSGIFHCSAERERQRECLNLFMNTLNMSHGLGPERAATHWYSGVEFCEDSLKSFSFLAFSTRAFFQFLQWSTKVLLVQGRVNDWFFGPLYISNICALSVVQCKAS